ncbi:MAG: hypothetical protein ACOC97_00785 [Myxococcota bacterium]
MAYGSGAAKTSMPTADLAGGVSRRYADLDLATGAWRHLYVLVWRNDTTLEGVERVRKDFRDWAAGVEGPLALITVVQEQCPLPSPEARKDLGRWLGEISDRIRASAVIYEGAGFKSASVRGVVTGLTLIARQAYPHKVFASVSEAALWLSSTAQSQGIQDLPSDGITTAVRTLRASLE